MSNHGDLELALAQYKIQPISIEPKQNVSKVVTAKETYAVKRAIMTDSELKVWKNAIQRMKQEPINIVPLIKTPLGSQYVRINQSVYYLMPWLEEDTSLGYFEKIRALFTEAGSLHRYTKREQRRSGVESVSDNYQKLVYQWNRAQNLFENLAYRGEHRIYPSPMDQHILNHVHQWMLDIEEAKSLLESWRNQVNKQEALRTSICHNKLSPSHMIITRGTNYLINFENVTENLPVFDLAQLLRRASVSVQWTTDGWRRLLRSYEEHFPLNDEERDLLKALLLFPEPIMTTLLHYLKHHDHASESAYLRLFERERRRNGQLKALHDQLTPTFSFDDDTESNSNYEKDDLKPTFDKTDINTD